MMKLFPVTALYSFLTPKVTACLASLALAVTIFAAPAAYAQTADGETPADEFFCDDNFDGQLRGLCNAFCEAMDCDSLDAQASANACIKMEDKIAPILEEENFLHNPDFAITMANPMTNTEGLCGLAETGGICTFELIVGCFRIGKRCRDGVCEDAPER